MADPEAVRQAMERISRSMRSAILEALAPLPLPARDDPAFEATARLHLAHAWLTIHEHPDLIALRGAAGEV